MAAGNAPEFGLYLQVTCPAKPLKQPQTEVGARKSESRTAEPQNVEFPTAVPHSARHSNVGRRGCGIYWDWVPDRFLRHSKFYILHSTFALFPRCYPLLFQKIKPQKPTKSTCWRIRRLNFPVFTATTARTRPRPSTPLPSSIRFRG